MTTDGDAIAEAAAPLKPNPDLVKPKPNLTEQQVVNKVRFRVKNQRDCGGASVVGAATVAISLLIGDGKVTLTAFYILLIIQLALIYTGTLFAISSAALMPRKTPGWVLAAAAAGTVIQGVGLYLAGQLKQHGSNVGSAAWWWLLVLASLGALFGLIIRRSAESLLDELDDESWKQRIAPLVNKQREAITAVSTFEIKLQAALKAKT